MKCAKRSLAKAVRSHRDFHFFTGLIADKGIRALGIHRCLLTKPLYKAVKLAGYANVALASMALVLLED